MGLRIESGVGDGYEAKVTSENKLRVYSTIESEISFESETNGRAYIWTAAADWGADKNALWICNNSTTQNLIIEKLILSAAAAAVVEIWVGSGNTIGGTVVTGVNINRGSNKVADAVARHTNTNVDAGAGMTLLMTINLPATDVTHVELSDALILGYLDEIAVNFVTDVGASSVNVLGYYHIAI